MSRLPDINEDGSEVVVILCSLRYGSPDTSEHDTVEEAKSTAEYLVDANTAAPVAIVVDGDLKLFNSYDLRYDWVIPNGEEAAFVKKHWPEFFVPKLERP